MTLTNLEESLTKKKLIVSEIVKEIEIKVKKGLCPYRNRKSICTNPQIECKSMFYKSNIPCCKYRVKTQKLK